MMNGKQLPVNNNSSCGGHFRALRRNYSERLDNALAGIPARLEKAEQQLDNLSSQQEAAQAELGKPFPQEAELAEKSVRLAELDALLNMDDRGNDDPDREKTAEKPSVLAELRDRAGRIPPMAHRDDEEVAL